MTAFITPGPVQLIAVGLLVTGVVLLVRGHRSDRFSGLLAGTGAFLATMGAATAWVGFFTRRIDGPLGWVSVPDIFSSLFASWLYVFVLALCAAGLWIGVERRFAHRWSIASTLGVFVGSFIGSVILGLLDSSISPLR